MMISTTSPRLYEIDLLRFIAAFFVVIFHYTFRGYAADHMTCMPYPTLSFIGAYGYLGVELFFMISGFVIMMSTQREGTFKAFVTSRIVRLYPAFWIGCSLTFLVTMVMNDPAYHVTWGQYLINLTMLNGYIGIESVDGVYWSLFVELKFYFLVCLLIVTGQLCHMERWLHFWGVLLVINAMIPFPKIASFFLMTDYGHYFIAGAFFYRIWLVGISWSRILMIGIMFVLSLVYEYDAMFRFVRHYQEVLDFKIVGLILTLFFLLFWLIANEKLMMLRRPSFLILGVVTYPLYLIHQNIGYMIFNANYNGENSHVLLWGTVLMMLLVAWGIARYGEQPLAASMKKFFLSKGER